MVDDYPTCLALVVAYARAKAESDSLTSGHEAILSCSRMIGAAMAVVVGVRFARIVTIEKLNASLDDVRRGFFSKSEPDTEIVLAFADKLSRIVLGVDDAHNAEVIA